MSTTPTYFVPNTLCDVEMALKRKQKVCFQIAGFDSFEIDQIKRVEADGALMVRYGTGNWYLVQSITELHISFPEGMMAPDAEDSAFTSAKAHKDARAGGDTLADQLRDQLCRLSNMAASLLANCDFPKLSPAGTAQEFLRSEIQRAAKWLNADMPKVAGLIPQRGAVEHPALVEGQSTPIQELARAKVPAFGPCRSCGDTNPLGVRELGMEEQNL